MLESLVASLLNRVLGSYVKNFDPKQLNIGIWGGDVRLTNLELKKEALDRFRLPINVTAGYLGELVLQIPWSNLKNKPVKVALENIYLLAEPRLNEEYDAEEEDRRAQALKQEKLENLELIGKSTPSQAGLSPEEIRKNQSFTESLVTKIIDNLQITIKNIHVRYEDDSSVPDHPFALGITLAELSAVSTDSDWNPIFIQEPSTFTRKLTTLDGLALYWNTDATSIKNDDRDQVMERFKNMIARHGDTDNSMQHILKPVSGAGRITINKDPSSKVPKHHAELVFEEIGFVFDSDQYRDLLWTADLFRLYMKTKDFKKFRPNVPLKRDPKAWFRYAAEVVLSEIHQKHREWSWDYICQHREQKIRYMELYKKKSKGTALTTEETDEYKQLEHDLSYENIRFYRSLVKVDLRKEQTLIKATSALAPVQSWSSWIWGSSATSTTEAETPMSMTKEQKQELYDAIEWDEKAKVAQVTIPREQVTLQIMAALKTGSFKLRNRSTSSGSGYQDIGVVLFNGFKANFFQRPDSFLANISLQEFRIDDGSPGTLYEQIVTVKSLSHEHEHTPDDHVLSRTTANEDGFFWLMFEHNPLDGGADSNLVVRTKSITVFYNRLFIEPVARFFKPPKTHLETIGAIMNAAGATVEGLKQQSRIGLQYVLEEHKTINVKLDLQAPLIVLPLDVTSYNSPCAIIDAGHISVTSDLVKRKVIDEIKNKKTKQYTESDWKHLESLMYDKYNLELHDTQFLIGANVRDTVKEVHNKGESPFHVIDRTNMDFLVEISIVPQASSLTRFKVSGKLPMFRAAMSDAKYKLMMQIIDNSIPRFDEDFDLSEVQKIQQESSKTTDIITRRRTLSAATPIYSEFYELLDHGRAEERVSPTPEKEVAVLPNTAQKVFEFQFNVEKVQLALHRCVNDNTLNQDLLVDMTLESFQLDYYYKPLEMGADVKLKQISIDDYIDRSSPAKLRKIATSEHLGSNKNDSDLFHVEYLRQKRSQHSEFTDQRVDVSMSTIQFVVAPKTFLAVLDFIITTFTSPEGNDTSPNSVEIASSPVSPEQSEHNDGKIDVKVNLKSIIVLLNDDGIQLATLRLDSAVVGVLLVSETMKVESKIGNFSLHDDVNEGTSQDSILRQLISIEGDGLADFLYETYNRQTSELNYNSSLYFRSGSLKINVVEEPLARIVSFISRLNQMKGLYDRARQLAMNQSIQIEDANKTHLDIVVRTPILIFPISISEDGKRDLITSYLGEIYLNNEFKVLENEEKSPVANDLSLGIRSMRLVSDFVIDDGNQFLEIIDNLDVAFSVSYIEAHPGLRRPSVIVSGYMSDIKSNLTDVQLRSFLEILRSVSRIFVGSSGLEEREFDELEEEILHSKNIEMDSCRSSRQISRWPTPVEDGQSTPVGSVDKVDFSFHVETVSLTLFSNTQNTQQQDIASKTLTKFSLNDTGIKLKIKSDDEIDSDIHVHSFTVHDTRKVKENKFTEIIPSVKHSEYQFMCKVTRKNNRYDCILSVDSPQMILVMDYLLAVKSFLDYGLNSDDEVPPIEDEFSDEVPDIRAQSSDGMNIAFHINVVDFSVIILADPQNENSEALVFKAEQLVLSQNYTLTLSISKVGMYLSHMKRIDDYNGRLRILDDFSITASVDNRSSDATRHLTSIQISIEPLVLRVSLRDILLALNVIQKASALASSNENPEEDSSDHPKYSMFSKSGHRKLQTGASTAKSRSQSNAALLKAKPYCETVLRGEELVADMEGLRLIVIGSTNVLPIIDMCVKPFSITAKNWSSDLRVDMLAETFTNVFNTSRSAWEPLIENWDIGFHASKASQNENMFVDVFSRKLMEITVTSETIGMLSKSIEYLYENKDKDDIFEPRVVEAPYRIKNETGYEIDVWYDTGDDSRENLHTLADGEEVPWKFMDWHVVRENLSISHQNLALGVQLHGSPYSPVTGIGVSREGENLYILLPKTTKIGHRLLCEIKIEENQKRILLKSSLTVKNVTHVTVELAVNPEEKIWTLDPGASRAIPIQHVFDTSLRVRPDPKYSFAWSEETIKWKSLLSGPESVTCDSLAPGSSSPFYFQVDAQFDRSIPLSSIYPYMTLVISAPIEVVNLLPFDFHYRIYCEDTKTDWGNIIKRGQTSPVHVVNLSQLLLLSVHVKDAGYDRSDFAIINSNRRDEFKRENDLICHSRDGQRLKLKIHYYQNPDFRTGQQVVVFSPYLILNKTGLDLQVSTRMNQTFSKVTSFDSLVEQESSIKRAVPKMWSFERDERSNRAVLQVGESRKSDPLSFEAIGSNYEVIIPSQVGQSEIHLGVSIGEGQGKYKLTKTVAIAPRFIIFNKLGEEILMREPGSTSNISVMPHMIEPIHFLKQSKQKQLSVSFLGTKSKWSAPFIISNVGRTFLKLFKQGKGYVLLKMDILLEGASLFIHIEDAGNNWPYSIRNFTNFDFIFYQANPYVDDQGVELPNAQTRFVPIKYKIPGKSVMPYSWDYPAAPLKELIISSNGRERRVQLAEIGNLSPMKVPNTMEQQGGIVDLNVVADGPLQTLVLSDYDASVSLYRLKAQSQSQSSLETSSQTDLFTVTEEEESASSTTIKLSLEGVGISLINRRLVELCYVTFRGLELKFRQSDMYETLTLKLKWIQIDNQLYGGIFPVILFPSVVPKSNKEMENHPTLSGSITRIRDETHGVLFIKHATILLQQMTLEMDEDFLFSLLDFAKDLRLPWGADEQDTLCDENLQVPEPVKENSGMDVYFELLHIQPSQLDLSFVRTERINVEDRASSSNALAFFFNILTMAIGNINDAPVKLNALVMENVRTPLALLGHSITTHYSQEFFYQMHKIIGSADFLGNPVGLFNNISSGFMDIFYEPYLGYTLNDRPQELGIGLAKGGASFVKKSIFGVSDSISKVTGSISKGLTVATMDKQFQARRRSNLARNKPNHVMYGLSNGATSLVENITSGVAGLALSPMEGAAQEGAAGFFKGLGKGLVGLPTKAAIGFFDLASNVSEGVRNTTTVFDGNAITRLRPPRYIDYHGIVRPYSQREAIGQSWMKAVNSGAYFDDQYLAHLAMTRDDIVVLVTFNRIVMMSTVKMTTEWEILFQDLQTIVMERTGLSLILRGGVQGPFIPVKVADDRRYLYGQISIAVTEFNRKHQTLS